MTLLETVVAFVLLSIAGVACLDLSRGALELERRSDDWVVAVARAESALAAASLDALPRGDDIALERSRWSRGVDRVAVTVALPDGGTFRLSRLVRVPVPVSR